MAKDRKVIRTTYLYKKNNSIVKKIASFFLFAVILASLIGVGFIVSKEWAIRFGEKPDIINSSDIVSSDIVSSEITPSVIDENNTKNDEMVAQQMDIKTLKSSNENIKKFLQEAKDNGYNTISIPIKTEDGIIHYKTNNKMAQQYGSIAEDAVDISIITKMVSEMELKSLFVVSTLKDPIAPHVKNNNSYAFSNMLDVNWLDNSPELGGKAWLNPYMENARIYLKDIAVEISNSGADYIVLSNVIFPEQYTTNLNVINETTTRDGILKQLQDEISKSVLEKTEVITQVDLFKMATKNDRGLTNNIKVIGNNKIIISLDVAVISENKKDIWEKSQVFGDKPFDDNLKDIEMIEKLLSSIQAIENIDWGLSVNQAEFKLIEPVLDKLKITNYIII